MNRKRILVIALVATMLLLGLLPLQAQGDVLTVWADNTRAPLLSELVEEFEFEDEFGFAVEIREIGAAEARDELLQFGEAGEGPDILFQPHDNIGQLVANGAILPIDLGDIEEDFNADALNLFTLNDELWAMPYSLETIALIRNVDLVPEAPATWQEVRTIAEELQADGKYAFLVQTGDTYHNFAVVSAFGGYIFGSDGEGGYDVSDIGLNSEGGLAAAEWLSGMYNDGLMVPDVDDDVVFALFESGDLAMFVTGPWYSGPPNPRIQDAAEAGGFEFSIDPIPGAEGISEQAAQFSGGQGIMISAFSDNQLLAEQFLFDFVATPDVMEELADRIPVFEDVESDDPNIEDFVDSLAFAQPMPQIQEMSAVWGAAGDALSLISQGSDPVEAFNTATEQIVDAIGLLEERVVSLPGSWQDEVGCDGEWNPGCEAIFMEDQGDGIFTFTAAIPAGEYEFKVAMGTWDENYGADGVRDGDNIPLVLEEDSEVTFTYDDSTNIVTFEVGDGS